MSDVSAVAAKEPRPYQDNAVMAIHNGLDAGISKQLIVMATGLGKTFTAIKAVNEILANGGRMLWCTHTAELLEQSGAAMLEELFPEVNIKGLLAEHGGLIKCFKAIRKSPDLFEEKDLEILSKIGIVKAENFDIDCEIVLASAQTLWRRLDQIPADTFNIIVVDECHLFGARTFLRSLEHFEPELLLGLTATPYRKDGMPLGNIFDKVVFKYGLKDAIRDGYLVELDAIQCRTNLSLDSVNNVAGELNQGQLTQIVDTPQRNRLIVEKYQQYAEGQQNIVYCVDVNHAINVKDAFLEAGYSCECIVGDENVTSDRGGAIERFKSGQTQIVTNCMILTVGFDHPPLSCITMACPTKSLTKYIQSIGRGTRALSGVLKPGMEKEERLYAIRNSDKPHCTILDIVDNSSKHNLMNAFTLDKTNLPLEKIFMTKKKREEAEGERLAIEMEAIRFEDKKVELFKLPPTVYYDYSPKMKEPATEKQLKWIKKLGFPVKDIIYTKGMASRIISDSPAWRSDLTELMNIGYDISSGVTKGEYEQAIKEHQNREYEKQREKRA
jgi:superfamily II DNA or RNA helicase